MKYAWIEANRDSYRVTLMCQLLGVSRSGLHAARTRPASARAQSDAQLTEQIRRYQRKYRGCYGRGRIRRELSTVLGRPVNEKRVGRLMREHDLQSRKRCCFRVVTTDSKHGHAVAPNVLARDFATTAPNQKWLADLTYVPTAEGWLYLALILDLFSRKLEGVEERFDAAGADAGGAGDGAPLARPAGWSHAPLRSRRAVRRRRRSEGARRPRHHGVDEPQGRLPGKRAQRVSRPQGEGEARHNAPTERAFGTVKVECVHGAQFKTRAEAAQAIVEYIGYYNTERLHSSLGYLTPSEFERRWLAENERRGATAQ